MRSTAGREHLTFSSLPRSTYQDRQLLSPQHQLQSRQSWTQTLTSLSAHTTQTHAHCMDKQTCIVHHLIQITPTLSMQRQSLYNFLPCMTGNPWSSHCWQRKETVSIHTFSTKCIGRNENIVDSDFAEDDEITALTVAGILLSIYKTYTISKHNHRTASFWLQRQ